MNVLLFTPTTGTSAIARVSCLLAETLVMQGHKVVVVRTDHRLSASVPSRAFCSEIIDWTDEKGVMEVANQSQAVIYQIGDNYEFHAGAIAWLGRIKGLVCLHDFYLAHLFNAWAQSNRDEADAILLRWYGKDVASRFFEWAGTSSFINETADNAPMTEWIASQALAVVTHSHWGVPRVQSACVGPVEVVPLAYDTHQMANDEPLSEGTIDRLNLLTVGHINSNKRVSSVIRAIAASPSLRRKTTYRLVGPINPDVVLDLSALASALRVKLLVSGRLDDDSLAQAFADADVVSCLRWPSLEAASASAIESMLWGKPTIVTNTRFYKDLPDDCVAKVSPQNEVENIRIALERLDESQTDRVAMGQRARLWAASTYSPAHYARRIIDLAGTTFQQLPMVAARAFFSEVLRSWGDDGDGGEWLDARTLSLPVAARPHESTLSAESTC